MTKAKFHFKMPIGDWSSDGHGLCSYYKIESDFPVENVREAHFKVKEKTGIDLESLCSDYEDSYLPFTIIKALLEFGFNKDLILDFDEELFNVALRNNEPEEYDENSNGVDAETVANIWLFLLNHVNPELNLKIIPDKEEMLVFYGFDEKGRHISCPGYGCFTL